MELVIVILFFSLSSAVCVQLFVKAHQLDQETIQLNHSVIWTQNLAETYRAYSGDMEKVISIYKDQLHESATPDSDPLVLYFDVNWDPVTGSIPIIYAAYSASLVSSDNTLASNVADTNEGNYSHGSLKEATITVYNLRGDTPITITEQKISLYVPSPLEKEALND